MNIFLIRHGEIPSIIKKVYAGRSPEGLTENGIRQADHAALKLRDVGVQALYSSPVRRAVQTAEAIGTSLGLGVIIDDSFREMELGPWEGLFEYEVEERYPDEWRLWHGRPADLKMPGRESLSELLERVLAGIEMIRTRDEGLKVAVVTHVAIIRVLLLWNSRSSLNLYKTVNIPNGKLFEVSLRDG